MHIAPNPFIIAIEIPISSFFALRIFEEPAIADEPHIAFPIPSNIDKSLEIPKILPIRKQTSIDKIITKIINRTL